jgi:hypothetical protein
MVNDSERIRDNRWQFDSEIRVQNASVESMRSREAVEANFGMLISLSPASWVVRCSELFLRRIEPPPRELPQQW